MGIFGDVKKEYVFDELRLLGVTEADYEEAMIARAATAAKEGEERCPGHGDEAGRCDQVAGYESTLVNEQGATYCERHARMSCLWWEGMGFEAPLYHRMSDGRMATWRTPAAR